MRTSEFDYVLPPERIAQEPLAERDASRLLVLELATGSVSHRVFRELPSLLAPGDPPRGGDLLVLNDTRVFPARLHGRREETGGRVEALFLEKVGEEKIGEEEAGEGWLALTKSGGTLRVGEALSLADGRVRAAIVERRGPEGDLLIVRLAPRREGGLAAFLAESGHSPVPPYVHRDRDAPPSELDRERYQTSYAREEGAVAAPTAGLHFTRRVFGDLEAKGVARTFVTLRVGPGTFRPVKVDHLEAHEMGAEHYVVPADATRAIAECRAREGRLVAVGTTTVRTLESAAGGASAEGSPSAEGGARVVTSGPGVARLFISPGYEFRALSPGRDALLTNFHLPRGTPLFLVCAFAAAALGSVTAGSELVLDAYDEALREGYRFLSYGDAMLIV